MAAFCVSCGNPLADGARFCNKCGATQPTAPAAPAPVSVPASAPPVSQGTRSCVYIGYRVKQKAHEFSTSMGSETKPYTGRRQPCAMLSTNEASTALGQTVTAVEQRGTMSCEYTYGANGHFDINYTWQGGGITMGLARGAMKHVAGMDITAVEGIGDEAYLAPGNSALMMRKGDVLVQIDLRESGVNAEAAENMARKIASHL